MRVLALGSCRIHDPLIASHREGRVDYLNRRFKTRHPIYLHDIHEMTQFMRLARGEIVMPAEIGPFAFDKGLRLDKRMPAAIEQADCLAIEICTDKHYEAVGFTLNVNEVHRQLVEATGAAGAAWWAEIDRGDRPSEGLVQDVEAALRARRTLSETHRLMLRGINFAQLSPSDIARGMAQLRAMVDRPILVMPHVAVRLAGGEMLAERLAHVEKTLTAARDVGLPTLDPRDFVARDGQERAMEDGGADTHHYAKDYLPTVGAEIVRALSTCG
jgi:hypothetical protein